MKYTILCLSIFFLFSCKNLMFNAGLEAMGIFDDVAEMHIAKSTSKTIVLLPTHHLGTPLYYDDLNKKIDSLNALDYFFYTEKVQADSANDTLLRKFRKFSGNPVPGSGYKNIVDSVLGKKFNVKLKKKLIDQPSYFALGIPVAHSENVDTTLKNLMDYYEANYGEIKLASCDFETSYLEESTCPKFKVSKEIRKEVFEDFRNEIVLKRLDVEELSKIVIIYGDAHTPGLLQGLKERDFLVEE